MVFSFSGLTDRSEYETIRFDISQDHQLHWTWTNGLFDIHGQLFQKPSGVYFPSEAIISMIHNAVPHLFDKIKLSTGVHMDTR